MPIVVVSANYPGASPQEMERLIIKPIEDQLDGIDNLDQLSSTTQEGSGSVVVQFKLGTDLNVAAINVQNAVDTARVYMPADLDPPYVYKNGATEPLLDIAVSSNSLSATQLADKVNNRLEPAAQVYSEHSKRRRLRHDRSRVPRRTGSRTDSRHECDDARHFQRRRRSTMPTCRAGFWKQPTSETSVSMHAEVNQADDLARHSAARSRATPCASLKVGDVAIAEDGHVEQRSFSHFNGHAARVHRASGVRINADEINDDANRARSAQEHRSAVPRADVPRDRSRRQTTRRSRSTAFGSRCSKASSSR